MSPLRGGIALLLLVPTVAPAQQMRSFAASRRSAGEQSLHVIVTFASGNITLRPSTDGSLFRTAIEYDAERSAPLQEYAPGSGELRLGLRTIGATGVRVTSRAQLEQRGDIELSPDIPLALEANLGAAEARLDLGGLTLTDLTVKSGATDAVVDFSLPTRGECRSATFSVGAGQIEIRRAAQSGCAVISVTSGASDATLDFSGEWRRPISVVARMTMGQLTLRIPRGTGVTMETDRFLAPLQARGFQRSGNQWVTPGFASAAHRLRVQLNSAMAGVSVEWIN